ncbi:MAG: ribosome recycling factor [Firmicutes bacterium]|nr:ribosome recycling factor [Bacillota bacterium]
MFSLNEDKVIYEKFREKLEKFLNHLGSEFNSIRAGRANPKLLDKVMVDYYGTMTPINQMGNISAPDPRTIAVAVWDISQVREVVKAIQASDLGLTPSDDGKVIRLSVPQPTEERRVEFVKMTKKLAEDCRINMRNERRVAIDEFKSLKKDGKITEDDLETSEKEVQKILNTYSDKVDVMVAGKEKEILEV